MQTAAQKKSTGVTAPGLSFILILTLVVLVIAGTSKPNANRETENYTPVQAAAVHHFAKCDDLRGWRGISEKQRILLLSVEGCHPDDKDDPRIYDAPYPWNPNKL